ncbi:MAG: hypothetical protein PHT07_16415, partial [Paludibacter sp.]|nr:hypothetical protein [Paludibacter sp.]
TDNRLKKPNFSLYFQWKLIPVSGVICFGLRGGCLGVGWGLPGGSEGPGPRNPQATPSKGSIKSLDTPNGSK